MKRKLFLALIMWVCFLLQCTLCKTLAIGSISPNLLVLITSCFGFMGGRKEGLWVGFFCGLLEDIFYGRLLGMHALLYMYIGYVNGYFNRIFYGDDIKLPLALISVSELFYGLGMYGVMFLMRSRFSFPFYLMNIIIPELVYTLVVTLIIYRPIYGLYHRLEEPV